MLPRPEYERVGDARSARNRIIFIDTCIAVQLGFRFDRAPLTTLIERRKRGQAFLAIPSITLQEWLLHGERLIRSAAQHVAQSRRRTEVMVQLGLPGGAGLATELDEEAAVNAMSDSIRSFVASNSLNPVLLKLKPYDAEEVLRWYFDGLPPFGDKKDKCQFPDAFVVSALCEWARRNEIALRVVTTDAAMSLAFAQHGNHDVYARLDKVLTDIARDADPLYEHVTEVIRRSEENFRDQVIWCLSRLNLAASPTYRGKITAIDALQLELDATFVSQDVPGSITATAAIGVCAQVQYALRPASEPTATDPTPFDAEPSEVITGTTQITPRLTAQVHIPAGSGRAYPLPYSVQPESDTPVEVVFPTANRKAQT